MEFELKPLSPEGIQGAFEKIERYRLLNEPWEAESICRDLLAIEPGNQEAIVALILCLSDRFKDDGSPDVREVQAFLPLIDDEYERVYYAGLVCERRGTSILRRNARGTGPIVHRWLVEAMRQFEGAEALRPPGNEDSIIRWNTCARVIMQHPHVRSAPDVRTVGTFLE